MRARLPDHFRVADDTSRTLASNFDDAVFGLLPSYALRRLRIPDRLPIDFLSTALSERSTLWRCLYV